MSDASTTREIIRWADRLEQPYFISVNTIEGHAPYNQAKYGPDSWDIRFTKPLSEQAREILTAYTRGLHNADSALQLLIDYFRGRKEPTLIVFYGDHLPILGKDLLVYRETGLCPPGGDSASLPMRTVPAVIWNNYGKRLQPPYREIGMPQMLPIVLDLLEAPKPAHVRLVEKVGSRWPIISTVGSSARVTSCRAGRGAESVNRGRRRRRVRGDLPTRDSLISRPVHFSRAPQGRAASASTATNQAKCSNPNQDAPWSKLR